MFNAQEDKFSSSHQYNFQVEDKELINSITQLESSANNLINQKSTDWIKKAYKNLSNALELSEQLTLPQDNLNKLFQLIAKFCFLLTEDYAFKHANEDMILQEYQNIEKILVCARQLAEKNTAPKHNISSCLSDELDVYFRLKSKGIDFTSWFNFFLTLMIEYHIKFHSTISPTSQYYVKVEYGYRILYPIIVEKKLIKQQYKILCGIGNYHLIIQNLTLAITYFHASLLLAKDKQYLEYINEANKNINLVYAEFIYSLMHTDNDFERGLIGRQINLQKLNSPSPDKAIFMIFENILLSSVIFAENNHWEKAQEIAHSLFTWGKNKDWKLDKALHKKPGLLLGIIAAHEINAVKEFKKRLNINNYIYINKLVKIRNKLKSDLNVTTYFDVKWIMHNFNIEMSEFISEMWSECINVLGIPPCKYVILKLGSFSRKEACSGSDYEFAIVVDSLDKNEISKKEKEHIEYYFKSLTILFEMKMIQLGETPLPYGFEFPLIKRGLCFDDGGNVPFKKKTLFGDSAILLENLVPHADEVTPQDMITVNLLLEADFLCGNKDLFDEYSVELNNYLKKTNKQNRSISSIYAISILNNNRGHFNKEIDDSVDIKKNLLHPIYFSLNCLARYYHINARNTYERIEMLIKKNVLSEHIGYLFKQYLNMVYYWRMKAHLFYEMENDEIYFDNQKNPGKYYVDKNTILLLKRIILIPLINTMSVFIEYNTDNDLFNCSNTIAAEVKWEFNKHFKQTDLLPFYIKLIDDYTQINDYSAALQACQYAHTGNENNEDLLQRINNLKNVALDQYAIDVIDSILIKYVSEMNRKHYDSWHQAIKQQNVTLLPFWDHKKLEYSHLRKDMKNIYIVSGLYLLGIISQSLHLENPELRISVYNSLIRKLPPIYRSCAVKILSISEPLEQGKLLLEEFEIMAPSLDGDGDRPQLGRIENEYFENLKKIFIPYNFSLENEYINFKRTLVRFIYNQKLQEYILNPHYQSQWLNTEGKFKEELRHLIDGKRIVVPVTIDNKIYAYAKVYPEMPGVQFSVNYLTKRLSGNYVPNILCQFIPLHQPNNSYPVSFSKAIVGDTIQNILRGKKCMADIEKQIDHYYFTWHVLETLLINPEDDKFDNLVLSPVKCINNHVKYRIISCDNDHAFVNSLVFRGLFNHEVKVMLKSAALLFEEMLQPLDINAVNEFKQLNWYKLLSQWLLDLEVLNKDLIGDNEIKLNGLFSTENIKNYFAAKPDNSLIPIIFEVGTIKDLCQRFWRLQSILSNEELPSNHQHLMQLMDPKLAQFYIGAFNKENSLEFRFSKLPTDYTLQHNSFGITQYSSKLDLNKRFEKSITIVDERKKRNLKSAIESNAVLTPKRVYDSELNNMKYENNHILKLVGEITINKDYKALSEFEKCSPYIKEKILSQISFSGLSKEFQFNLLSKLKNNSLRKLYLNDIDNITNEYLFNLLDNMPDIESLYLHNCSQFNVLTLYELLIYKKNIFSNILCQNLKSISVAINGERYDLFLNVETSSRLYHANNLYRLLNEYKEVKEKLIEIQSNLDFDISLVAKRAFNKLEGKVNAIPSCVLKALKHSQQNVKQAAVSYLTANNKLNKLEKQATGYTDSFNELIKNLLELLDGKSYHSIYSGNNVKETQIALVKSLYKLGQFSVEIMAFILKVLKNKKRNHSSNSLWEDLKNNIGMALHYSFLEAVNKIIDDLDFLSIQKAQDQLKNYQQRIQLNTHGLEYIDVKGSGHCVALSIGESIKQTEVNFKKIIVDEIEQNSDRFSKLIKFPNKQSIIDFVNDFKCGKEWDDHTEIEIIMMALDRPIVVIMSGPSIANREILSRKFKGEPIFVYYDGQRKYDALVKNDNFTSQDIIAFIDKTHQKQFDSLDTYFKELATLEVTKIMSLSDNELLQNISRLISILINELNELQKCSTENISFFIKHLNESKSYIVKCFIVKKLGQLARHTQDSIDALLIALNDSHWYVNIVAARALGELKNPHSKVLHSLLKALLNTNPHVREAVLMSLIKLNQSSLHIKKYLTEALDEFDWDTIKDEENIIESLKLNTSQAYDDVLKALDINNPPHKRRAAIRVLGQLDTLTQPILEQIFTSLGDDTVVYEEAKEILYRFKKASPEVVSTLIKKAKDDKGYIRRAAIQLMAELQNDHPQITIILLKALNDPIDTIRLETVKSLSKSKCFSQVYEAFFKKMSSNKTNVKIAILNEIAKSKRLASTNANAILKVLNDKDPDVKYAAIKCLGKLFSLKNMFKHLQELFTYKTISKTLHDLPDILIFSILQNLDAESLSKLGSVNNKLKIITDKYLHKNHIVIYKQISNLSIKDNNRNNYCTESICTDNSTFDDNKQSQLCSNKEEEYNADNPIIKSHSNIVKAPEPVQSLLEYRQYMLFGKSEHMHEKVPANESIQQNVTYHNDDSQYEMISCQPTEGRGDCAFHAIFGKWNGNICVCDDVVDKRKEMANRIRTCNSDPVLYRLVKEAIKALIMENRSISGRNVKIVQQQYQQYTCSDQKQMESAWGSFNLILQRFPAVIEFIDDFCKAYCVKKNITLQNLTFKDKFQICLNESGYELRGKIQIFPELGTALIQYNDACNSGFDWETIYTNSEIINEYAYFVETLGNCLLPVELQIIGYVFNITIDFYLKKNTTLNSIPQKNETFCPGKLLRASVCFNGINHYEKMASQEHLVLTHERDDQKTLASNSYLGIAEYSPTHKHSSHSPSSFWQPPQIVNREPLHNSEKVKIWLKEILSDEIKLGTAISKGDCFFDAIAQGLNQREGKNEYDVQSLRILCDEYAKDPKNKWVEQANKKDREDHQSYLVRIRFTANELEKNEHQGLKLGTAVWGRPKIEGKIFCEKFGIKLHIIEIQEDGSVNRFIVDDKGEKEDVNPAIDYGDKNIIHIVNYHNHYVPLCMSKILGKRIQLQ